MVAKRCPTKIRKYGRAEQQTGEKLEMENREWVLGTQNRLRHALPVLGFPSPERPTLIA